MKIQNSTVRAALFAALIFFSLYLTAGGPGRTVGLEVIAMQSMVAERSSLTEHYYYDHRLHYGIGGECFTKVGTPWVGMRFRAVFTTWQFMHMEQRDPRYPQPAYPYENYNEHYLKNSIVFLAGAFSFSTKGEKRWFFTDIGPNVELLLVSKSRNFQGTATGPNSGTYSQLATTRESFKINRVGMGLRFGFATVISGNIYGSLNLGLENVGLSFRDTSMGPSATVGVTVYRTL